METSGIGNFNEKTLKVPLLKLRCVCEHSHTHYSSYQSKNMNFIYQTIKTILYFIIGLAIGMGLMALKLFYPAIIFAIIVVCYLQVQELKEWKKNK